MGEKRGEWWGEMYHLFRSGLPEAAYHEIEQLARRLNIKPKFIVDVIRGGPNAADELKEMLFGMDIAFKAAPALVAALLREMQLVCASCGSKAACRAEARLAYRTHPLSAYCANADAVAALNSLRSPFSRRHPAQVVPEK